MFNHFPECIWGLRIHNNICYPLLRVTYIVNLSPASFSDFSNISTLYPLVATLFHHINLNCKSHVVDFFSLHRNSRTVSMYIVDHTFQVYMINVLSDNGSPCLVPTELWQTILLLRVQTSLLTLIARQYPEELYQSFIHSVSPESCPD